MARLIPSDITAVEYSTSHSGEIDALKTVGDGLPNDYTVFHSLHWSNERSTFTTFGEIDFVIVNRSGDLIVIEQKDGELEETGQGLMKRYGRDNAKNVGGQVHRNIDNIRDKFANTHGKEQKLEIDYLIYCPSYKVANVNAASIDMSRIVDAAASDGVCARIESLLGPGAHLDPDWTDKVIGFFNQSLGLVPDVSTYVSSQETHYTRLTSSLMDIVDRLEFSPFRLRILGTAGSGKSQVALHTFNKAVSAGQRALLLCYNRPLADRLKDLVTPGGQVVTYLGFCSHRAEAAGHALDYNKGQGDPDFWPRVQELLVAAEITDDDSFDCLVVDEGQDFQREWWDILELYLKDGARVIWMEDQGQNIYGKPGVPLESFVTYRETRNFRSPQLIAGFINNTLDVDFEAANPLPGLGVHISEYDQPNDQIKLVAHRINELVRRGFKHEDIVVVSCRGLGSSVFGNVDKLGALPVRRFTGEYSADGDQIHTDGKIYADSIYRFKGQQAPAVILVDIDERVFRGKNATPLLYCGMTRAMVHLDLVVQRECSGLETFKRYAQ